MSTNCILFFVKDYYRNFRLSEIVTLLPDFSYTPVISVNYIPLMIYNYY